MLTTSQIKAAQSIINIFETDAVLGDYGSVTVIPGDTGHLTFGRSQTTLGSGNLHQLIERYCANGGGRFGLRLQPYLPRLQAKDLGLDQDFKLHNVLRASADDPIMRETQDQFFDDVYWRPAARVAAREGITCALGAAIVYDSKVHGSWERIRDRTKAQIGAVAAAGERPWLAAYVANRRHWLTTHARADLRKTGYRMEAFQRLIDQGYWNLELPLVVRGHELSLASFVGLPRGCYDGPQPGSRALTLATPLQRGLDVRLLQLGLSDAGMDVKADGVFGPTSGRIVKLYQTQAGLPATGVADIALIAKLVA